MWKEDVELYAVRQRVSRCIFAYSSHATCILGLTKFGKYINQREMRLENEEFPYRNGSSKTPSFNVS